MPYVVSTLAHTMDENITSATYMLAGASRTDPRTALRAVEALVSGAADPVAGIRTRQARARLAECIARSGLTAAHCLGELELPRFVSVR